MGSSGGKRALNVTIDRDILEKARKLAEEKHVKLANLIENFLDFYVDPEVYCFKCGSKFRASTSDICPKCGWMKCSHCGVCRCELNDEVAEAIFHMRKVYEDLLVGRVKHD